MTPPNPRLPPLPFSTRLRYLGEAVAAYILYGFFRILPPAAASWTGGRILSAIGPRMGISRVARQNILRAFPEKTDDWRENVLRGMWENLGRVIGEYPHLRRLARDVEMVNAHYLTDTAAARTPAIFFSGHTANWEISGIAAKKQGLRVNMVYRRPNNIFLDGLLRHARGAGADIGHIAKGNSGGREIVSALRRGEALAILMDQKLSNGVPVPFFGYPAMTAPAAAHFALRFGCPVYPVHIERLSGTRFRLTVEPPLAVADTGDTAADTLAVLGQINARLEDWIRQRPEQWLWLHRRWPDDI